MNDTPRGGPLPQHKRWYGWLTLVFGGLGVIGVIVKILEYLKIEPDQLSGPISKVWNVAVVGSRYFAILLLVALVIWKRTTVMGWIRGSTRVVFSAYVRLLAFLLRPVVRHIISTARTGDSVVPPPEIAQTIRLRAEIALLTSNGIKLEAFDGIQNVGYWSSCEDSVTWSGIVVNEVRVFDVWIDQACKSNAGGEFELSIGPELIKGKATDTGSWGHFEEVWLGTVYFADEGQYSLRITPMSIREALMNVRSVRLIPKASGLYILRARWGVGQRIKDVTAAVRSRIANDRIEMKVLNENLGLLGKDQDPAFGTRKELTVEYVFSGTLDSINVAEGLTFELPRGRMGPQS